MNSFGTVDATSVGLFVTFRVLTTTCSDESGDDDESELTLIGVRLFDRGMVEFGGGACSCFWALFEVDDEDDDDPDWRP